MRLPCSGASRTHDRRVKPGLIAGAKRKGAWRDMGNLKRFLMDDLLRERNQYAKRVMTDVRGRRRELERVK